MTDEIDAMGELLPDEVRLKKVGKFLRSTSLDELPELINILKGEMSFVGPRPLLVEYLELYNEDQKRRHEVRPGLTGLAQVNGRNAISWEERFKYDVEYVDNISFKGDLDIVIQTIKVVFSRKDINSKNSATMEKFKGNQWGKIMNEKLLIIGAGGHGKVVADIAMKLNKYKEIAFLDDVKETCMSFQIIGKLSDVNKYINDYDVFVAIGSNDIRRKILEDLKEENAVIPTIIHPSAIIGENVTIGEGTVVMPGTIINADAKIGNGCIINTAAVVEHDCIVDDYVHISVGTKLAGNVNVGKLSMIGIGATIINNVKLCENITVGAGAVVVRDILESGTYIGVPSRKIK